MTNSIRELRESAKCDPDAQFDIPFDFKKANAIRTMLDAWSIVHRLRNFSNWLCVNIYGMCYLGTVQS